MKIERILEIGIAVEKLEATSSLYTKILGAKLGDIIEDTKYYNMRFQMCRIGNVDFELMESIVDSSVVGKFIDKRGPGLHHVAFKVPNIPEAVKLMKQKGIWVITEPPTRMNGISAIFLGPKSFNGVMFELIEGLHHWVED